MLWYRVMKRWRVRWGRGVGASLHFWRGIAVSLMVKAIKQEEWLYEVVELSIRNVLYLQPSPAHGSFCGLE